MAETKLTKKGQFFDYSLLIIVLVLIAFGLVMVYSTSSYNAAKDMGDAAFYLKKQLVSTIIGLACMFVTSLINYRVWYKFAPAIYIISVLSVLLVLTPIGLELNNARRWISIFGISVQPAEIVKLGLIIALAAFISYSGKYMKKLRNNVIFILLAVIPALMILLITNNLSTAIILAVIAYIMLIISNPKPTWLLVISIIGVVLVAVFLCVFFTTVDDGSGFGFRFQRLLAWRNPNDYASGTGYQTIQALYALGSGGFFGKGLGQSIQKLGFIPEAQNDMIFSVVCEELGLFGGIALIILFMLLIYRLMVIANNAPDLFGSMLVTGVMAHIAIQVILNIAVVTNTIPNTGVTLPFISYGGTSVMFLMIEMGISLNVSREIRVPSSLMSEGGRRSRE